MFAKVQHALNSSKQPALVIIGHLTTDLLPGTARRDGGTALYAAITAQRLGLHTAVLSAAPSRPESLPPAIELALTPASVASTFENRYGSGGRRQWLHAVAPPIDLALLPAPWRAAPLVHIGPVLHEVSLQATLDAFPQARFVVTPQGWMRRWAEPLPAPIAQISWLPTPSLLRRIDLLVLSSEDLAGDEQVPHYYRRHCPRLVITRGAAGATLYTHGAAKHIPTTPVEAPDPTGLGDVFAAAMLIGLHEQGDDVAAARFATLVASAAAAGSGLDAIPLRTMLPQLTNL